LRRFNQLHHLSGAFLEPQLFAPSGVSPNDQPIAQGRTRLEWLTRQLKRKLEVAGLTDTDTDTETEPAVVWYMRIGFSLGVSRTELQAALSATPALHGVAANLSEEEVTEGKPPPEFAKGQLVEVIAGPGGASRDKGTVRGLCWHQKEGRWIFFIKDNDRNVSKLYEAKDLRAAGA
jgi:hypothetical protein